MKEGRKSYGLYFWTWLENEHPIADAVIHGALFLLVLATVIHEIA